MTAPSRIVRPDVRRWFLPALVAGALACVNAGCSGSVASPEAKASQTTAEVETAAPEWRAVTRTVEQPARVEAFEEAPVYAKISGYVEKVNVEIGQHVKKGDVLA